MPRDRDLVRRAAQILSADGSLRQVYDELSTLLASYVDASIVLIVLALDGPPVMAYAYLDGTSGEPDDGRLSPASTSGRVFETGIPVRYRSARDWPAQHLVAVHGKTARPEAAIFVPIVFGGERIGVLSVQSTIPDAYSQDDVALLETCALYLGARIHDDVTRKAVERYERASTIDVLTGVANRAAFDRALERDFRRAGKVGSAIACLMLDVDYFKAFNDTYGHVAGDACLQQLAGAVEECLVRPTDLLARYGGEEFAVILPDTEADEAIAIAETMRRSIERIAVAHGASSLGRVSMSIGAAAMHPHDGDDPIALVRAADAALYEAKARGRNRVAAQGYAPAATPAEPRRPVRGNLPAQRTRFIGRRHDLSLLRSAAVDHRLTTMTGSGGVGKTRIALEVARSLDDQFPDGVWFVDMTAIADEGEVPALVAAALRGLVPPRRDAASLVAALHNVRALLVLDNCEHVIEGCAAFADRLLSEAPGMRVLATSREALSIEGEFVYRVPSLGTEEAIALFVDRAASAGARGVGEHESAIAEIVRQLDGIPLAIELAAARLPTMSLEELRAGLADRLAVLRGTNRRAPSRQQTLRALMDWSYRLLAPAEQVVFRRLAVFEGGWTREAAVSVCSDENLPEAAALAAFERLVDRSLLQLDAVDGESRFRMLETTRAYAAEMLARSGDAPAVAARHARTYLRFVTEMQKHGEPIASTRLLRTLSLERGNLQAAILAFLDAGSYAEAAQMAVALRDWLWERGSFYAFDLTRRLDDTLRERTSLDPAVAAAFGLAVANSWRRADPRRSLEVAPQAFDYYRAAGDMRLAASVLRAIAHAQLTTGGAIDPALERDLETYAARMEAEGERSLAAMIYNLMGMMHTQSMVEIRLERARDAFHKAIALLEAGGNSDRVGTLYGNSADVAFYLGDLAEAMEKSRRAVALIEQSEEPWSVNFQYMNLGQYATLAGDYELARSSLRRAYAGMQTFGDAYSSATILDKFARLAFSTGRPGPAARILGAADAAFERGGVSRQRREERLVEKMRAGVRVALGDLYAPEHRRGFAAKREELESEIYAL